MSIMLMRMAHNTTQFKKEKKAAARNKILKNKQKKAQKWFLQHVNTPNLNRILRRKI